MMELIKELGGIMFTFFTLTGSAIISVLVARYSQRVYTTDERIVKVKEKQLGIYGPIYRKYEQFETSSTKKINLEKCKELSIELNNYIQVDYDYIEEEIITLAKKLRRLVDSSDTHMRDCSKQIIKRIYLEYSQLRYSLGYANRSMFSLNRFRSKLFWDQFETISTILFFGGGMGGNIGYLIYIVANELWGGFVVLISFVAICIGAVMVFVSAGRMIFITISKKNR